MQLAGELSKISLPSLIQLVRNGGLTGEISLAQGTNSAKIFVEQGRIVHVESDLGVGREAFLELFLWLAGTFSFVENDLFSIERTFPEDEPIDRLLREGVAYLEEKKYLDQLRINGQTVLKPSEAAKANPGTPLVDRLDGRKTLAQALADANLSRRAYVKAVYQLLTEGLVVVAEPVAHGDQVDLPGWVVSRLKQDNADLSQAIVDMVIWVDRIKCWMYQADSDLENIIEDLTGGNNELLAAQLKEQVLSEEKARSDSELDKLQSQSEPTAGPVVPPVPAAAGASLQVPRSERSHASPSVPPAAVQPAVSPARPGVPSTPVVPGALGTSVSQAVAARLSGSSKTVAAARSASRLESGLPGQSSLSETTVSQLQAGKTSSSRAQSSVVVTPPASVPEASGKLDKVAPYTVARATPVLAPAGSGKLSDIAAKQKATLLPQQEDSVETQNSKVKPEPENEPARLGRKPARPSDETDRTDKGDDKPPPQAVPKAPWTRAAVTRKPFFGGGSAQPPVPPQSIEF